MDHAVARTVRGAMPASPATPDPRMRRNSTVSAWSSSVWAVAMWVAPMSRARPTRRP